MDRNEQLMKEYELCQRAPKALEATIWQTASLLGIGSAGGIALVAGADRPELAVIPAGIVVVSAGFLWWELAQRWYSVEHVRFTRMILIERALRRRGQASYIQYLNDITPMGMGRERFKRFRLGTEAEAKIRSRHGIAPREAEELQWLNWGNYYRPGPRDVLEILRWLNLTAWVIFAFFTVLG